MQKKIFSFILIMFFIVSIIGFGAETIPITKANYKLPARFTPNKMRTMVFSTFVDAHWLKHSDRFWYIYETSEGKSFNIIDPARKTKRPIFDNVRMAAELTKMTKDPYEAKHLPIDTIKFKQNDKVIYFKVPKNEDVLEAEKRDYKIEFTENEKQMKEIWSVIEKKNIGYFDVEIQFEYGERFYNFRKIIIKKP